MLVSRLEILNETHPASKKACSQGISFSQQHLLLQWIIKWKET